MDTTNLLDAIRVVKENERIAAASYADAALRVSNPAGKLLFEQLSKFESFHYEKLTALEASLEETGEYIEYEGKEFPLPPVFDIEAVREPNTKSVMTIVHAAMDLEQEAEKAYADLANQTSNEVGYEMFRKLSEEEHKHYLLLLNSHWTLNNRGTWKWDKR